MQLYYVKVQFTFKISNHPSVAKRSHSIPPLHPVKLPPKTKNPNETPGPCWQNIFFSRLHTHWQSAQRISSNTDNSYDTVFVLDKTKPSCDQMSFDSTYRPIQVLYEFFNMTTKEISWIRLLLGKRTCLLWVLKCFFNALARLKTFRHSLQ